MQKLQLALQRAIKEQTHFVEFALGQFVSAWSESGQSEWSDFPQFTGEQISALLTMLFPNAVANQPARGQIEIPNFGILLTIGISQPTPRIVIFLPAGHSMFDQLWSDVVAAEQQVAPIPADLAAPPPMAPTPPIPPPLAPPVMEQAAPVDLTAPINMFAPPDPEISRTAPPPAVPVIDPAATLPVETISDIGSINMFAPIAAPAQVATASEQIITPPADQSLAPLSIAPVPTITAEPLQVQAPMQAPIPIAPPVDYSTPVAAKDGKLSTEISKGPKEIDQILRTMVEKRASDLHITTGEPVAMRIDGEIVRFPEMVWSEDKVSQMLDPITSDHHRHLFSLDNDADFAYEIAGLSRFRVNIYRDRNGRCAVLRQIPNNIPSFEQLGLPDSLKKLCFLSKGLVVVTGPTGSGKSTTLAALMDYVNTNRHDHILTMEDPIEFVHKQKSCLIHQREIYKHTNSFSRALKAALREDPDIILVGELRDLETTALAIEIAETGHLVFGTLHTTTAVSTIDRIIDQFSADRQEQIRTMLAESLKGVVAQTLLKKQGGGRVAAQEILMVNGAVSALIREAKIHMIPSHMQSQKADGNVLLNEALMNLVNKKIVLPKDAWIKAVDKANLIERMRQANVDLSWYQQMQAAS